MVAERGKAADAAYIRPIHAYSAERLAAVERRRAARRARSAMRKGEASNLADLGAWESAVVLRMTRRYVPPELRSEPIFQRFAYWQLRRCGWDVITETFRKVWSEGSGWTIVAPESAPAWLWWTALHYESRYALSGGGRWKVADHELADAMGIVAKGISRPNEKPDETWGRLPGPNA